MTRRRFDSCVSHIAAWFSYTGRGLGPVREEAERFLRVLDPDAVFFSFRTYSDSPYTRRPGHDPLERALRGSLAACWDDLVALNQSGAAISVTINTTSAKGRSPHDIVRVRALFVDDDYPGRRSSDFEVAPHITVESSPGRFHHYWLTRELALEDFSPFQKRLAALYATDHKVWTLNQSMALPGFWRRKNTANRFLTTIVKAQEGMSIGNEEIQRLLEVEGA